ncbi:DNA cytosine-5,-methyltransferase, variant 2 [Chamberlinius hualienensis]
MEEKLKTSENTEENTNGLNSSTEATSTKAINSNKKVDNKTAGNTTKKMTNKNSPKKETVTPSFRPKRNSKNKIDRLIITERSNTPDGIWTSVSRSPSPVSTKIIQPMGNSNGVIVWAKLAKYPWWPAMIMDGEDCGRELATEGTQWIFWLGDHKISKLPANQMVEFVSNFKTKFNEKGSKQYIRSVNEALTVCATRCSLIFSPDDTNVMIRWAKDGFLNPSKKEFSFLPDPLDPIPDFLRRRQEKIRSTSLSDEPQCENTLVITSGRDRAPSAIARVKNGERKVTEICLACDSIDAVVVGTHPLFNGGVCKECKEELRETFYAIGEDGTNSYCAICGSSGELIICDKPGCSKVYCSSCIKLYAADGQLDKVLKASPWYCYFCSPFDPKIHGFLRKADNWEANIIQLFHTDSQANIFPELSYNDKRPIRVLSLFDGIGTGRLVLDRLKIEVDIYYASEIDGDSMLVANVRHKMVQLGDVQSLSDNEVAKLCPIDLLIGGSPCNDLSLVNPSRKGLYDPTGTGKLFFDFFRILRAIQLNNNNNHLFWLYENVASMPHEYRGIISRFLQCEPSMIDSKYFSPQNRARYYWGNIPGLYSSIPSHHLEREIPLQSIVTSGCNRIAVVDKVRCITTRSNSLVQKGGAYPVEMNGKPDSLWINELEKAFGFPEHHTDIGNLSFNRRQHLLGRAWTVPVIEYILKPLTNFFKVADKPDFTSQT